ncbi:hypothetical protein TruAng_003686 [Truncatella angustata]|nr:hypothetical protein TruAng_003686 [Truncatella angustata]
MGQPEEAHSSQPQPHDDPPPPYADDGATPPLPPRDTKNNPFYGRASPTSPSRPSSSRSKQPLPTPVRPTGRFPNLLGMYYQKAIRTPTFNLGESEDQPLLSVTFHQSATYSGQPYLILHSSADPGSPPLAIAEKAGRLGQRAEITLPGLEGSEGVSTEEMGAHISITSVSYAFTIETGDGQREKFEWRSSKGSEVKSLSSDKHPAGRKLVRISVEAGVGGTRAVRDEGATSDGREIVAAWADNAKWSGNKAGVFQFLGSGATGELGERFSVMALVSAVRIWEMINEKSLQSAATPGLGAGYSV